MGEAESTPPKILREAMDKWLDAQRQAVELMASAPQPGHPVDWAEGYRWVTRIAALAQEYVIEYADSLRPTIYRSQGPTRKLMVDNPDVNYYFVHLDEHEHVDDLDRRHGPSELIHSMPLGVLDRTDQARFLAVRRHIADRAQPVEGFVRSRNQENVTGFQPDIGKPGPAHAPAPFNGGDMNVGLLLNTGGAW